MLTAERVREVLDYDPETGVFTWRQPQGRAQKGSVAGAEHNRGYWRVSVFGKYYLSHRLAWLYVHGEWPSPEIDHINGDPRDNRLANLRLATRSQNLANKKRSSKNTSGFKGVDRVVSRGKWRARIKVDGTDLHLGLFSARADAVAARAAAEAKYFGEFAYGGD